MSHDEWIADFNKCLDAWDGKYIITSPDIDGILSACLLADKYGAKLAGIYTTRYLILFDDYGAKEAKNALWLDHDISEEGVQCMGQHLVDHSELDTLSKRGKNSFNPNNYYGQTWKKSFRAAKLKEGQRDKYPYATIHFLMAGMGVPCPKKYTKHFHLLAHADGSWATCVDYKINTMSWKDIMFGNSQELVNVLTSDYILHNKNLVGHSTLVDELIELGISKRGSRVKPTTLIPIEWRKLQGKQSISYRKNSNPQEWLTNFNGVMDYVSSHTGWNIELPSRVTSMDRGLVLALTNKGDVNEGDFDRFMFEEEVFSHAITDNSTMRFTRHLKITDEEIISYESIKLQPTLF